MRFLHRRKGGKIADIEIKHFKLQGVSDFNHNRENNIYNLIVNRIMSSNRTYYAHIKLFVQTLLSKRTKLKLNKTLIHTVATYTSEIWTLLTSDNGTLSV